MSVKAAAVSVALFICFVVVRVTDGKAPGELEGCAGFGSCCPGKNISCFGRGPSQNNKTSERCFCDEDCPRLGDCCLDYRFSCRAVNCLLSEHWSEWTECNQACGVGAQHRRRQVLVEARNGGKKCSGYIERRMCEGFQCKAKKTHQKESNADRNATETANIVPAVYASWRKNVLYNPLEDIRQSLFLHQIKYADLLKEKNPSYCVKFRVTETRRACHHRSQRGPDQPQPPRTAALTIGKTVCVECQPFGILQRTASAKCVGDGTYNMETTWNAVTVPRCHGKWIMTSQHQVPCHCDRESEASFLFV